MVDAQTIGVLVTAASVSIAAIYYTMTLRVQRENMKQTLETRRIGLIDSIMTRALNEEGMRNYIELLRCEWSDFEDFEKKYGMGSDVNATAKRYSQWQLYNSIGMMLRKGMVEAEDIYEMGLGMGMIWLWEKYQPIIEENRLRYNGPEYLKNFEYLACEMSKVKASRDLN
jgi:hypothetical protein